MSQNQKSLSSQFKVDVTNIKFNHDTAASTNDAINIRKSFAETFDISSGEWNTGGMTNHPMCYTTNMLPTVKARFTVEPDVITNVTLYAAVTNANPALFGLSSTNITFSNGISVGDANGYVTLSAANSIPSVLRKSADTWQWNATGAHSTGFSATPLATTGPHTVYTIFAEPEPPWDNVYNNGDNKANAWVSALNIVCSNSWAINSVSITSAAIEITRAINESGRFMYETNNGAAKYSSKTSLNLTACIDRLSGGAGISAEVNCTDCANFVVAFANLIGGKLYASIMGGTGFATNPYSAIGRSPWTPPRWGWGFSFHEVAWDGACGDSDLVFDACLRVNGNGNPTTTPRTEELPAAMQFSDGSWNAPYVYREKLSPPNSSGYGACVSRPSLKKRRTLK